MGPTTEGKIILKTMSRELEVKKPNPVVSQLGEGYRNAVERVILDLDMKGLRGEHVLIAAPLLQATITGGVIGKISSFLVLGTGRTEGGVVGEVGSEPMLTFAWKPTYSDEMYVSGVPASKVIVRRREDVNAESQATTVEFQFNLHHFVRIDEDTLSKNPNRALTTVEYLRPDHYIKPEALREVIIWATEEDSAQLQSHGFGKPFGN